MYNFTFITQFCILFYFSDEPVQMCSNNENDVFISDIGTESSLSIDFRPNASNVVCNRQFYAPDGFGFYIKFYRLSKTMMMVDKRTQKLHRLPPATVYKNNYSCPLNIVSGLTFSFDVLLDFNTKIIL